MRRFFDTRNRRLRSRNEPGRRRFSENPMFIGLVCNGVLGLLILLVNQTLAPHALYINLDILFVLFPSLFLQLAHAIPVVAIAAFCLESSGGMPPGTYLFLFGLFLALLHIARNSVQDGRRQSVTMLALLINLFYFAALTLLRQFATADSTISILRLLQDFLLSELALFALASPWVTFQRNLASGGVSRGALLEKRA